MTKVFLTLGCFSLCISAFAQNPGTKGVVLEVNGQKYTLADLEQKHPGRLFSAYNTFSQTERKAIEEFADEMLLERQAKKENVTVAELLDMHVNKDIGKDPSEESLRIYFEGVDTTESFETMRPQIVDHIRQRRQAKAKTDYMKSLHDQAKITIPITAPRSEVSLKNTPVRGSEKAPVMLVEYADYECPYCQQIQPTLDKLQAEYKDKLAMAYKDVPLPMHPHAPKAAEAARCAGEQGKYWEYHDVLYAKRELDLLQLKEYAASMKLDTKAFDQCLDSGRFADTIKSQLVEAQSFNLEGTPSFFINGRFFSGGLTLEQLRAIVNEELAAGPRAVN